MSKSVQIYINLTIVKLKWVDINWLLLNDFYRLYELKIHILLSVLFFSFWKNFLPRVDTIAHWDENLWAGGVWRCLLKNIYDWVVYHLNFEKNRVQNIHLKIITITIVNNSNDIQMAFATMQLNATIIMIAKATLENEQDLDRATTNRKKKKMTKTPI